MSQESLHPQHPDDELQASVPTTSYAGTLNGQSHSMSKDVRLAHPAKACVNDVGSVLGGGSDAVETHVVPLTGLTYAQVEERIAEGRTNRFRHVTSRSIPQIIRANVFTLFNAILTSALVLVLIFGNVKDALFGIVMIANALTGILSEIRAKRTLDALAILETAPLRVIREGELQEIPPEEVVQDDLVHIRTGDQIPADGVVRQTERIQIDESILTGESQPQYKKDGDRVLSGSSVISGEALIQAVTVGAESYANQLGAKVRKFRMARSELESGVNKILTVILFALPFIIAALVASQIHQFGGWESVSETPYQWKRIIVLSVAGVVSMIPQGLVLLTSVNFASAALMLARQRALVQELPAVEILARVDTLCLDKTGTITSGDIQALGIIDVTELHDDQAIEHGDVRPTDIQDNSHHTGEHSHDDRPLLSKTLITSLGNTNASAIKTLVKQRGNATAIAIDDLCEKQVITPLSGGVHVPFSSIRKWSLYSDANATWVMGAPEVLMGRDDKFLSILQTVESYADRGYRVIGLMRADTGFSANNLQAHEVALPKGLYPLALLLLAEEIRPDAPETLAYFSEQGVDVKVISGDNPHTVAAIAQRAGLATHPTMCDARQLADTAISSDIMRQYQVFGRVTPEQKCEMVRALQDDGHVVAMTGDGVNDALALKDADLGIAMGSGAQATKATAKVVLLDSQFSVLPSVLAQGRRVLGNMERVSTLFFTKTVYAVAVALIIAVSVAHYPYLPRHLTLVGTLTIGVPAFILALAPSQQRYRPGFLTRTLSLALPSGIIVGVTSMFAYWMEPGAHQGRATAATLTLAAVAIMVLAVLSRPLLSWRGVLVAAMAGSISLAILITPLRHFFELSIPSRSTVSVILLSTLVGWVLIGIVGWLWNRKYYPSD
ncbi:MAG: HAD-IC family P-type ATPase [Actinomycetaceae bacterium]|nr:HAD-IC family P-type ATPase [Actinomycetaceae bacterium]